MSESEPVDLFNELASKHSWILDRIEQEANQRDGVATLAEWHAEDGWIVTYTTSRVEGGPHHGKFVTQAFRPVGPGARTNPQKWVEAYRQSFSKRATAKKRALAIYRKHSPKWAERAQA